ncbi:unnamed protein product [Dracunculus medinensis]|uniref:F-actin monooxygenase n=1 Tax=Dracunculus medinensis TaxID=318479 RepID=A0A158Q2X8_DRAME|nr:unnamed protein product [Dracunculus medinensis]
MDANLLFDAFASATTFSRIQQLFGQLCTFLEIDQFDSATVYKNLKNKLTDWRAKELWSVLDRRATQKEYCGQAACKKLNVLVIGAGPCGLRSAIECALLGAHVVLVEQRDCFSRNNVLHIWPFVIQDLKNLGIKIFYPKFCRGSIDHISIRQLQIFLAKVALIVGVQIHDSVTFRNLIFPKSHNSGLKINLLTKLFYWYLIFSVSGWRAQFQPSNHILSEYIFDALIGADGKRNSLPGFPKQEMRGKLAIGITANFINQRTLEEEKVPEISGVSYIFNQQFFKEMKELTGVDLENIVYYKDETHYFVMCAKKQSLLEKGVIIEDNEDISLLLSPDNVNQEKLCDYAASAADFATEGKLPALQFAINHNEKEDVAMFDFTSFYSAKCSVRLVERHDQRLIMAIVGDSLHEPFWPTGSGIARGFLGVFDTSWMLRSYGLNHEGIMLLLAERESAYRLLAQAKPDNLQKQLEKYTIDPRTRYVSFELSVQPHEISHLVDTDNPRHIETNRPLPLRNFVDSSFIKSWDDGRALAALVSKFRPDILDYISLCSLQDADRMIQTVFTVLQSNCEIEPPAYNLCEWKSLPSADRINYLSNIIRTFQADSKRMRETLENAITNAAHKRKAKVQVDASKAKKTEPILRRTSSLLKAFSSVVEGDKSDDKIMNDFLDGEQGCLDDEKIREVLLEMNDEEMKQKQKRDQRLKVFEECFNKSSKCNEKEVKFWTKRPVVEKLHPERLFTVEKIISGELEAEKNRELYHNKRRLANIFTRKMEKKDIDEMEMKLEQTGMGVLFDKEHFRVMSSKEQKIISANAAAARQIASDGFKHDNNKFKDIDEKLAKADNILKNQNLAGINTVSRALKKPSLTPAPRPAPPTPPKKVSLREFANHSELEQCSDQENGKISFRNASLSKTKNGRPVSMPIIGLSCESVNARRQVCCQLCTKFVYLAERMQVEGMFIHKSCFRCAYCEQPLRLGHCAQDRNLHQFNPRFIFPT